MSRSTEKTLALLDLVAKGHRTLAGLAEESGLPKSTTHRLVSVLLEGGYLKQDGRAYRLGHKLLELGERAKQELRLPRIARPHMEALSRSTRETVHLGELADAHVIYLEKVDGSRGLQMASYVGLRSPAQTTAMGKVLLAHLHPDTAADLLLDLPPRTEHTKVERRAILEEFERVRDLGYALDREENEVGIRCISAPIWDSTGQVVAAVSLSGATQYITRERQIELVPPVTSCALNISRELGGTPFVRPGPASESSASDLR